MQLAWKVLSLLSCQTCIIEMMQQLKPSFYTQTGRKGVVVFTFINGTNKFPSVRNILHDFVLDVRHCGSNVQSSSRFCVIKALMTKCQIKTLLNDKAAVPHDIYTVVIMNHFCWSVVLCGTERYFFRKEFEKQSKCRCY